MGMDQKVVYPLDRAPTWPQLAAFLAGRGFPLKLMMIDGELAFPDEVPAETWRELRVGTPQGMVTLRREAEGVSLVTWSNADAGLRQAWNALAWAVAALSGGTVQGAAPADFARTAELPASITPS
jgi:hypothetical protein